MSYRINTLKRASEPDAIERQAAADLVMDARRVTLRRAAMTDEEREAKAVRFDALALELTNAAKAMRLGVVDTRDTPAYLDPTHPDYMRPDFAARFHD